MNSYSLDSFGNILRNMNILDNSLVNLQFKQNQPKSAVAIIVKRPKYNKTQNDKKINFINDQILFLQRKKSVRDRFSGQICFPGGRQQPNQTIFEAAIRQTYQQTNIKLNKNQLIGCINRQVNFIISTKKQKEQQKIQITNKSKKQMVVFAFVFSVQSQQIQSQHIKLNNDQMQSYKWVEVKQLINSKNTTWFDYTQKMMSLAKVYFYDTNVKNNINEAVGCIKRALSPALEIGMNQKVYGITSYILLIIIVSLGKYLEHQFQNKQSFINQISQNEKQQIRQIISHIKYIKVFFQKYIFFQIKSPLNDQFIMFQKALHQGMYKMRPKL